MTGGVEAHQAVVDGHLVKRGALLVPKERIRYPDVVDVVLAEPDLDDLLVDRRKGEASVAPRLTQVHAHRIILALSHIGSINVR